MKKRVLQFKMTAKAVMITLLLSVAGMTKGYAQYLNGLIYNLNDNTFTATLVGHVNGTMAEGEVNIPETVVFNGNTYTVTAIGASAFAQFTRLTSICIPNTVTIIGEYAFWNCCNVTSINIPNAITTINEGTFGACGNLSSVSIPNTVITIGNEAFYGCNSLATIDIPNSVTTIGDWAFHDCFGLVSVSIGNSVTAIGDEAFCWCSNLESVNLPNSLTSIGRAAFCGCSSLASAIMIPNTITSIQEGVFSGCTALTSVEIPNSVLSIGSNAFWGCEGLTSIIIPNSVTSIEMMAFGYCNGFTSFTIPNSVTFLGDGVFRDCINLSSVYIGSSVSEIEGRLFEGCINLAQIVVDSDNTTYDSRDNCNAIIHTANNRIDAGCKTTIIPNTVTSIGYGAFIGCRGLTSIEIPNSVTYIHSEAFAQCSGLTSISIPNSVTNIDFGAFMACINLNPIILPNSVTYIGDAAFSSCNSLTSIEIPNSVLLLGNQLFEFCENLNSVLILNSTPPLLGDTYYCYEVFPTSNEGFSIYVPYESVDVYKAATNWSNYADYIQPMAYTTVLGYAEGNGNWQFIASPLVDNTAPTTVNNMISETDYDLYQFNQSAIDGEWQNYKANNFNLANGQGYLYANAEDVNLIFKGNFNEDETKEVGLAYDANAIFAGWNLVGKPFPVSAYANRSYYVMNEEGTAIEPIAVSMETAIPACTGVMVKADNMGETVTFSKTAPRGQENQGVLQIALNHVVDRGGPSTGSGTLVDKALVSFNAGDRLEKFVFNKDNASLSILQGGKDYAIAYMGRDGATEVLISFKAKENGTYTISVNPEAVELDYLHLIDNLTGADVDLLASELVSEPVEGRERPASYTFTAKTTDYESRFKLVFCANEGDGPSTGSGTFAFVSNGNIIVNGTGTFQVIDMTGRQLFNQEATSDFILPTSYLTPGVYVLRLIDGNDVKTQKIVIE